MFTPGNYKACLILFALFLTFELSAQNSISIGANLSAGSERFPKNGRFGKGLSVEFTQRVFNNGSVRLYAGYDLFEHRFRNVDPGILRDSLKTLGFNGYGLSFLPIRVGYQYTVFKNGPFVYAEAGVTHVFTQYENDAIPKNVFTYAVGTGYRLKLVNHDYVQLSVYYNNNRLHEYIRRNYVGFRAAYGFSFHKSAQ